MTPADAWRPIESAPRNKKTVLVWDRIVGALIVWWDGAQWINLWDSEPIPGQECITHWQPLPPPPEAHGDG